MKIHPHRCTPYESLLYRKSVFNPGTVYFIGNIENNLLKIGYTEGDGAIKRIKNVEHNSPFELTVFFLSPGCHSDETKLHREFKYCRKRGEWFDFNLVNDVFGFTT